MLHQSISFITFILLLNNIHAQNVTFLAQTETAQCPNPSSVTACLFVICENGGTCFEDSTTIDCYRCQCAPGFTGKICDTSIVITPGSCNPTCANGGTCNGNTCFCPQGFSGSFCETRNYCSPINPCQNGGQCISTSSNYVCDCTNTGFTGNTCTQPIVIDLCLSRPCQNGGQCFTTDGTVSCVCVNGYTGVFCQIAPIPCVATPCENGGRCELTPSNTYACTCPPEFTGSRCETSILANHPCVTNPTAVCLNGGTCTVNNLGYLCRCAVGWRGDNCQIRDVPSTCNPNPCGAYGSCFEATLPTGPAAFCTCTSGWTGKYCDVNMEGCPVSYCLSGGTCRMIGSSPYCECPTQYTGVRCETFTGVLPTTTTSTVSPGVNPCSPNPCVNGGTCFSNSSLVMCSCRPDWTGKFCSSLVYVTTTTTMPTNSSVAQSCSILTCLNGGSCYMFANRPTCVCEYPWDGLRCEENVDTSVASTTTTTMTTTRSPGMPDLLTCADSPCRNGGTCVPMNSSYFCFCGTNSVYTGKRCDSTTPMSKDECPLECAPGKCIFSGNAQKPYACLWNGIMRPKDGTTG